MFKLDCNIEHEITPLVAEGFWALTSHSLCSLWLSHLVYSHRIAIASLLEA